MTDVELATRFVRWYGGEPGDRIKTIFPIAPYILMDIAYQSYLKYVAPLKVSGRIKQYRNRWIAAYNAFNRQLFLPFKEEEYDEVVDRMDILEEYLRGSVSTLETALVNYLIGKVDGQEILVANVLMHNILAQSAQGWVTLSCQELTGQPAKSPELESICAWSIKFLQEYLPPNARVDTTQDPDICDAVDNFNKKIAKWIFNKEDITHVKDVLSSVSEIMDTDNMSDMIPSVGNG